MAPFPLYKGKPAPVILFPNSKSIMSRFLANSQWGNRLFSFWSTDSLSKTISLSESSFPCLTNGCGIFGIVYSTDLRSNLILLKFSCNSFILGFIWVDFSFKLFASSISPDLKRSPILLAIVFDSLSKESRFVCIFFLCSSSSIALFISLE